MITTKTDSIAWSADAAGLILSLRTPEARRIADAVKKGKVYTVEIKEYRKKRSIDANAYAWVLIDKLSEALHIGKTEIYRNSIRDIGGVSDYYCMVSEAYPAFKQCWESQGIGWQTEVQPSKLNGCVTVTAYRGSSEYDERQMSALIDHLVQDCKALDIETMTPEELQRLEGYG